MKKRTKLSDFQNDILWMIIFLVITIWSFHLTSTESIDENYFRGFSALLVSIISCIALIIKIILVNNRWHKIHIYRHKIKEVQYNTKGTRYYYKLLRPFLFFPIWYTDWEYSLELAKIGIEREKKKAKKAKEKYFRREIIKIQKIDG